MKKNSLYGFIGIAALFVLWEIFSLVINRPILPSPIDVFKYLFITAPNVSVHAGISLLRVATAMVISIILAVPIGIIAGYFSVADKIISPLTYIIYPIPKIALLPIAMLFLGLGNASKILIMVLILMFQLIITIRDGVKKIPQQYFLPYYAAGASFIYLARKIIFPGIVPDLFTGLRNSFAAALSVLFFSESYGTQFGMGYYILDAWTRLNYRQMYSGIIALCLVGMIIYATIDFCERKMKSHL